MSTENEGWIQGSPQRMSRNAVQCEWPHNYRTIVMCPACGGQAQGCLRHRFISPEIKAAYIAGLARKFDPNGYENKGDRLKSKCCDSDMVVLGEATHHYVCLNCLKSADEK